MPNTPIMDRLVRKTVERHLPWNVHIDLTYRCNERCVHCYLDHHDYGEMTGIKKGFIKRADLAWYCSHHHNSAGENVPYRYSYLFGYPMNLPAGVKTITLPHNDKIRILAISVADENPEINPAQPLYDVLPSPPISN